MDFRKIVVRTLITIRFVSEADIVNSTGVKRGLFEYLK
nr:hypothetical protein WS3_00104 [Pantoea sp.]